SISLFFFFQAEDGIRDKLVTGVQTCALPISGDDVVWDPSRRGLVIARRESLHMTLWRTTLEGRSEQQIPIESAAPLLDLFTSPRSEERRVGKEWRSWWWTGHEERKGEREVRK